MLCLKCSTNPKWIGAALNDLDNILIDHAHCEKKAAATGLSLLSTYPDKTDISLTMSDLVEEEIGHYRSVVEILKSRGTDLTHDNGDPYAKELLSYVRKNEPGRLLDRLITAAIIEARSCERLQLLGSALEDQELKEFYSELSATEAGHYVTFIKLAKLYFDEEEVKERVEELTEIEKNIVVSLPNYPTMHG